MSLFAQLTVNGLIAGAIYALVATGFSLIFSTNKFVHFAHGASVVVSAYFLYLIFTLVGMPFYLSCILTILFAGLFGLVMYRLVYVPLQNRKASSVILLIASLGLMILFQNLIQLIFGSDMKLVKHMEINTINFMGMAITPLQVTIIIVSLILLVLLYLFMRKTKLGRNMRAVSDNKELASIIGINSRRIANFSFFIGSALAGLAGILIGLEQNITPTMGTNLMIKGFTGAIIGGIGSVPGAVLGSFLVGFAENYGVWMLPSGYKDAIAFALLIIFLLFKPTGILGIDKGVKQ